MTGFLREAKQAPASTTATRAELLRRAPRRLTVTINWRLHQYLQERADLEGRSLSNLVAFLLERACSEQLDP
jgi:predicted HicB family RNase H-like nuclease